MPKFAEPTVLEESTHKPKAKIKAKGAKKTEVLEEKHEDVKLSPVKEEVKTEEVKEVPVKKEKKEKKVKEATDTAKPKAKRVMSEKQLESLAKGRAARAQKLAEKMASKKASE